MEKEAGYILLEVMLSLLLLGVITSLLVMINMTAVDFWQFNSNRVILQQEALISLERVVNIINQAAAVDNITSNGLDILTAAGEWKRLYYNPQQGLCWAADTNVISKQVASVQFIKEKQNFLIIELVVQEKNKVKKLTTGIEI